MICVVPALNFILFPKENQTFVLIFYVTQLVHNQKFCLNLDMSLITSQSSNWCYIFDSTLNLKKNNIDLKFTSDMRLVCSLQQILDSPPLTVMATFWHVRYGFLFVSIIPATKFIGTYESLLTIRVVFHGVHDAQISGSDINVKCEGDKASGLGRAGASAEPISILTNLTTSRCPKKASC